MYVVSRNSINTTKRWPCVSFYGRCDKRRNACHIFSPRCRPPTVAGVLGGQSYLQGTNDVVVVDAPFLRLQAFDGTRGKTTSMLVWRGPGLWSRSEVWSWPICCMLLSISSYRCRLQTNISWHTQLAQLPKRPLWGRGLRLSPPSS